MPNAGGIYVYLSRATGRCGDTCSGWSSGVVINPASIRRDRAGIRDVRSDSLFAG